jgi:hypothetical protein
VACPPIEHHRKEHLRADQHAEQVHPDDLFDLLERQVLEPSPAGDARVVDQDVASPEGLVHSVAQPLEVGDLAHVAPHGEGPASPSLDLGGQGLQPLRAPRR